MTKLRVRACNFCGKPLEVVDTKSKPAVSLTIRKRDPTKAHSTEGKYVGKKYHDGCFTDLEPLLFAAPDYIEVNEE